LFRRKLGAISTCEFLTRGDELNYGVVPMPRAPALRQMASGKLPSRSGRLCPGSAGYIWGRTPLGFYGC